MLLRLEGFDVYEAADGLTALGLSRQHEFVVALSDVQMPVMDGFALIRSLRRSGHYFPVILMSGSGYVGTSAAIRAGAASFLSKPFKRDELLDIVRATIEKPRTLAPPSGDGERHKPSGTTG